MSDVWAIFPDQIPYQIDIQAIGSPEELYLKPITKNINSDLETSAIKAINASFYTLKAMNLISSEKNGFSFDFDGNQTVRGTSASLAFALRLVYLYKEIPFSIAATGSVCAIDKDKKIQKINYINEKIQSAFTVLKKGDMIFFPDENLKEISSENIQISKIKGIKFQPIKTISEAVHKLICDDIKQNKIIDCCIEKHSEQQNISSELKVKSTINWCLSCLIVFMVVALVVLCFTNLYEKTVEQKTFNTSKRKETNINSSSNVKKDEFIKKTIPQSPKNKIHTKKSEIIHEPEHIIKPIKQTQTIKNFPRIKISLHGSSSVVTEYIRQALEKIFQHNGFLLNSDKFDCEIKGSISVSSQQEYPLFPYAGPSETLIRREIGIHNVTITSNHNIFPLIHDFSYTVETLKTQDHIQKENLSPLFNELNNFIQIQKIKQIIQK